MESVSRCELVWLPTKQVFSNLYGIMESKEKEGGDEDEAGNETLPVWGSAHFLDSSVRAPDSDDSSLKSDPPEENQSSDVLDSIPVCQNLGGTVAGPDPVSGTPDLCANTQASGAYTRVFDTITNRHV